MVDFQTICNLLVSLKSSEISLAEQFQPVTGLLPTLHLRRGFVARDQERTHTVKFSEAAKWQPYWVSLAFRSLLWHHGIFQISPFACV